MDHRPEDRAGQGRDGGGGRHGASPVASQGGAGAAPHARRGTAGEAVRETLLSSGTRVLTEFMPGIRSASVGVWVGQGGAHETPDEAGASHLLEHMVFKGTRRRSARDIALSLESLGGSLDAYTTREHTSYQARVLDEHLPVALDVLADLVLHPSLRDEDLELERQVVLEEIAMVEDTPDDLVFELHGERMWKSHPYGLPILGPREAVAGMPADTLRALHGERYRPDNLIVAAVGNVDHDRVVEEVERQFAAGPDPRSHGDPGADRGVPPLPEFSPGRIRVDRPLAQAHWVMGRPGLPYADPRRHTLILLSAALGGGMSSILFQRVREELGLAYTVFSFQSFYRHGGAGGIYLGTRPDQVERAEEAVKTELARLAAEGLSAEELAQTQAQVKGQITLSLESSGSRLHRLANFALYDEPYRTVEETLASIDAVTVEDTRRVAGEFLDPEDQFTLVLGPGA